MSRVSCMARRSRVCAPAYLAPSREPDKSLCKSSIISQSRMIHLSLQNAMRESVSVRSGFSVAKGTAFWLGLAICLDLSSAELRL